MQICDSVEAVSDKAETKSKGVDIVYSGRGMPFRVVFIITLQMGDRKLEKRRTFRKLETSGGVDACRSSRNTKANVSELSHRYAMRFLLCLNASL